MRLSLLIFGAAFIYGVAFSLPKKMQLMKKHHWKISNDDILNMAKVGDRKATALKKIAKRLLILCVLGTIAYLFEEIFSL